MTSERMTPEEISQRTRAHLIAFVSILVLAVLSAVSVYSDDTRPSVPLVLAAVQAMIVLNQMMHVYKESGWVKWLVAFCVVSVVGLAGTLYVGYFDTIEGTEYVVMTTPEAEPDAAAVTEH